MRAGWSIGFGVALALFGAQVSSACSLDLNADLIGANRNSDASGDQGDGAGGTLFNDAPWQDGSGGKGGTGAGGGTGGTGGTSGTGGTGAAGGPDGAADANGGSAGCSPVAEICDNGVDDDCDKDSDCADTDCAFQKCGTGSECKAGACVSAYLSASVACGNSGQTGTSLCQAAGWQGCTDSIGYWWWQCAGPGDCPGGWSGLTCSSYSGAGDCVGAPIGGSNFNTAANGCTTAYGATDFGYDCSSFNPGYTVRLECH